LPTMAGEEDGVFFSTVLMIGAAGIGCVAVLLWIYQEKLLYFPNIPPEARKEFLSPRSFGLEALFEEVFITTPDGLRLQAYLILSPVDSHLAPTILYFHGNAGNLSYRFPNIKRLVLDLKCNVLILSYRGYGKSEGWPTEKGLKIDAQAALDYLSMREDINSNYIILFGRSLGGAVALHLAAQNQSRVKAVMVENTFTSITDMIDVVLPFLKYVKRLCTIGWTNIDIVRNIEVPILFLSGGRDELVPPWMMQKLFDTATKSKGKKFHLFPFGQHMDTFLADGYYEKVEAFIRRVGEEELKEEEQEEELKDKVEEEEEGDDQHQED